MYRGADAAPPPRRAGPVIIDMRADENEEDMLWEVIQKAVESGGLDANAAGEC